MLDLRGLSYGNADSRTRVSVLLRSPDKFDSDFRSKGKVDENSARHPTDLPGKKSVIVRAISLRVL